MTKRQTGKNANKTKKRQKDHKESLILWCQGSFALLQCFLTFDTLQCTVTGLERCQYQRGRPTIQNLASWLCSSLLYLWWVKVCWLCVKMSQGGFQTGICWCTAFKENSLFNFYQFHHWPISCSPYISKRQNIKYLQVSTHWIIPILWSATSKLQICGILQCCISHFAAGKDSAALQCTIEFELCLPIEKGSLF